LGCGQLSVGGKLRTVLPLNVGERHRALRREVDTQRDAFKARS
jgi:hypothetical protein